MTAIQRQQSTALTQNSRPTAQPVQFRPPHATPEVKEGGMIGIKGVEYGTYGVQVRMGKPVAVRGPGMHWILPLFDKIIQLDATIQQTHLTVSARSSRGLPVNFDITVVHQLVAEMATEFLHNVGADYGVDSLRLLVPAIAESIRCCAAKFLDEQLYSTEFPSLVGPLLYSQLEHYGIGIIGLSLNMIRFDEEVETQLRRVAIAQMEQAVLGAKISLLPLREELAVGAARIEALASAARIRITADANAYATAAMRSEAVITDRYLELERIQRDSVKWGALENIARNLGSTATEVAKMLINGGHSIDDVINRVISTLQQQGNLR